MTDYNDDSRALMQRFNVVGPPTRRIRVASQSVFSQSVLKWEKARRVLTVWELTILALRTHEPTWHTR
jgi:hypothetical protein